MVVNRIWNNNMMKEVLRMINKVLMVSSVALLLLLSGCQKNDKPNTTNSSSETTSSVSTVTSESKVEEVKLDYKGTISSVEKDTIQVDDVTGDKEVDVFKSDGVLLIITEDVFKNENLEMKDLKKGKKIEFILPENAAMTKSLPPQVTPLEIKILDN